MGVEVQDRMVGRLLPVLSAPQVEEFSLFDVLRYGGHEKQISDVFAWLLDKDRSHNLGNSFVEIFREQVNAQLPEALQIADDTFAVRQEVNTSEAGVGDDIADLVLEGAETVIVAENYYISDGHGHSYDGYRRFGARDGKRCVVVLLCEVSSPERQTDGWEMAPSVPYSALIDELLSRIDDSYVRENPDSFWFLQQLAQQFTKGRRVNDDRLLEFVDVMCQLDEAERFGLDTTGEGFAGYLRDAALQTFSESRLLLMRIKAALKEHASRRLVAQVNTALGDERFARATANWQGRYQWTVHLRASRGDDDTVYLTFGPSAWLANSLDNGWQEWEQLLDEPDYTRLFLGWRKEFRQSSVTLGEALDGLAPDDLRLRDEIVDLISHT